MFIFNGALMKMMRKRKNMTLDQLASYIGSSKSYVWELEQGKSDPSGSKLMSISIALGVKPEHFYTTPKEAQE